MFAFHLQRALDVIGFEPAETTAVFQMVAAVLKLGNVHFRHHCNIDGTDGCRLFNEEGKNQHVYF